MKIQTYIILIGVLEIYLMYLTSAKELFYQKDIKIEKD